MKDKIEVVAFDADDTLWENELYFQEFEHKFCDLLKTYQPPAAVSQELFKTEMKNLHMYGYGLKSMMLSMIETACRITVERKICIAQKKLSDWDRNFCKSPSHYWTEWKMYCSSYKENTNWYWLPKETYSIKKGKSWTPDW